ncbi:MAG: LytTR family DNA-binding domain-containing protein [Pseudomonadota bacterium]
MPFALRELRADLGRLADLRVAALLAAVTVAATLAGPFGTGGVLPTAALALYWGGTIAVAAALSTVVFGALDRVGRIRRWPTVLWIALSSAVFTALYAPPLYLANRLLFRGEGPGFADLLLPILILAFVIGAVVWVFSAHGARAEAPGAAPFLRRLPKGFAGPLMRLEMQDHYVAAHGRDGAPELILMRFADAVRELEGYPGLQVHRSHWVAVEAVKDHRRDRGRLHLILLDGTEVPVSRSYQAPVRAAGLA